MTETTTSISDAATRGAAATIAEISRQPAVWRELADLLAAQGPDVDAFLSPVLATPGLRVVLAGAGTSAFAGGVAAPALSRLLHRRFDAVATTDIVADPSAAFAEDVPTLLVSFARSGNSPESLAATRLADEVLSNVHHLVITCDRTGALHRAHEAAARSHVVLMPEQANDTGFAMTSSFTSMLLTVLTLFSRSGRSAIHSVAAAAQHVIADRWQDIASIASHPYTRVVYLGSGAFSALAQEAALKLLELTAGRVVSFHDSALGFRHGPKAVLTDDTLAVAFVSADDYTRRYDLDIVRELRGALGNDQVLVITTGDFDDPNALHLQGLGDLDDAFAAVAAVVPAQILALSFALAVGTTPDNPFPKGDVNRVVQGVEIHPFVPQR
ncbi:MAG TPA: SIS domain-containing protein [Amnibacterium sp.]|nr:SIS domain-containing protein [Amnibacterium sp.]